MATATAPAVKQAGRKPTALRFSSRIALSDAARSAMGALLNARLADAIDLQRQAKQAHWNVRGPRFMELHELFDSTAGLAVGWSDDIAERVAQLGGLAEGSSRQVADRTTLPSVPLVADDASQWVNAVADSLGTFANNVREAIDAADAAGDQVTADLFTQVGGAADKQLWFVEAHLQGG